MIKGRGAQLNTPNRFAKTERTIVHPEGIDEYVSPNDKTEFFLEHPQSVLNKNSSPDIPFTYSINPYQGCEHGCSYCYARNVHQYWGYSAGIDFEQKIIVKPDAPAILRKQFSNKNYSPDAVSLSGNTDCYQPAERKFRITRRLLEVFLECRHPVGIITKNSLVLRDLDILKELASMNLVHVVISITTLDEKLRLVMEPRTASAVNRLKVIEELSANGIPAGVMMAPVIPGLNSDEIPAVIRAASEKGALMAGYTMLRLNGSVKDIFHDWLYKSFPDAADKVWRHVSESHGGRVSDSRFGTRMRGEGKIAEAIRQLYKMSVQRFMNDRKFPAYDYSLFRRPLSSGQLTLEF